MKRLRLTRNQLGAMQSHIESSLPAEACGLLAGIDGTVSEVIPIRNEARSSVRFRMDPVEQWRAFERIDSQGQQLLGVFHSHPAGPDHPSPADIAEAAYEVVHVIWSPHDGSWQAKGFWIRNGLVSEVQLDVAGSELASPAGS